MSIEGVKSDNCDPDIFDAAEHGAIYVSDRHWVRVTGDWLVIREDTDDGSRVWRAVQLTAENRDSYLTVVHLLGSSVEG